MIGSGGGAGGSGEGQRAARLAGCQRVDLRVRRKIRRGGKRDAISAEAQAIALARRDAGDHEIVASAAGKGFSGVTRGILDGDGRATLVRHGTGAAPPRHKLHIVVFVCLIPKAADRAEKRRLSQTGIVTDDFEFNAIGLHAFLIDELWITPIERPFAPDLHDVTWFKSTAAESQIAAIPFILRKAVGAIDRTICVDQIRRYLLGAAVGQRLGCGAEKSDESVLECLA